MGIPGVLNQIGRGERVAIAKLAVEHLERTQRPLRIAIDAAIWDFQTQAGQGGKNPALRTLYYRLLRLLALPIHPLFVYDGKNKPLTKRGQTVSRYGTSLNTELSKKLLQQFRFPCHTAPGEAEAECAHLQKHGLVDMVMSQDGDAIMFGSNQTLRNWSKEGARSSTEPSHIDLLDLQKIKTSTQLDPDGMILVALLSGGDYNQQGVPGFGIQMACDTARAGFGTDLLEAISTGNEADLAEWRDRLSYELETNESGYFKKKHKTVKVPEDFPDRTILRYYSNPAVSSKDSLPDLERGWIREWQAEIDIPALRRYVAQTFDWTYKQGAWKLVRTLSRPLLANRLQNGTANHLVNSTTQLSKRREHFSVGGVPELQVAVIPAKVVGLDLDAEEDSPDYLPGLRNEEDCDEESNQQDPNDPGVPAGLQSPSKAKKTPWDPLVEERMWLLETQVELGVPHILEEWNIMQREKLETTRLKPTRRKARIERTKSAPMKATERIDRYFATSSLNTEMTSHKDVVNETVERSPLKQRENITLAKLPATPTKRHARVKSKTARDTSPDLTRYFQPARPGSQAILQKVTAVTEVAARDLKHSRPSSSASTARDDLDLPAFSFSMKGSFDNPIALTSSPVAASTCSTELLRTPLATERATVLLETSQTTPPLREVEESVTQRRPKRNTRRKLERARTEGAEPLEGSAPVGELFPPMSSASAHMVADDSQDYELPPEFGTGLKLGFGRKKLFAIPRESLEGTWKEVEADVEVTEVVSSTSRRLVRVSCVNLAAD